MTKDQILDVCVAIKDCWTIDEWEERFHSKFEAMEADRRVHVHNDYRGMYRAALLFSLISLRKVADFAEGNRRRQDDMVISDFGFDLHDVTGQTEVIDSNIREKINKGVAHLTTSILSPDGKELDELREVLASKEELLRALMDRFFAMIPTTP